MLASWVAALTWLVLAARPAVAEAPAADAAAAEARPALGTACPVRLLDVTAKGGDEGAEEGFRLAEGGLAYLARQRTPLYVVPALGVYRGGKSLLLNRLMGLRAPYVGGFGVGHGQDTFTRGVEICAEEVEDIGTVVWMDTEGLFSSEEARSAYGPKLFSLALLFSSSVLLNSVKVLNDQFFAFFGEQQQLARVLKQGLAAEGLPQDALLPKNLSVFWVLQQPIRYSGGLEAQNRHQLDSFLRVSGDEARERVSKDFHHLPHEVPTAAFDTRLWERLDQLSDEELLPEYVGAARELRGTVFQELRRARPLQASGVATQLRMYVELVETEHFSGAMAKEAFEESEIGNLCGSYARVIAESAGTLPAPSLSQAFEVARRELEPQRAAAEDNFHFGREWVRKLERCLRDSEVELGKTNSEMVLAQWQKAAGEVADQAGCFFLGELARLLRTYDKTYGAAFGTAVQRQAVDYATALQRTRLVECVRLRDFLWPFAPWLAWPLSSLYLRSGPIAGCMTLALHLVVLAGVYTVLQMTHQLPSYVDVDYPVLRAHPVLLNTAMRAPPLVPWFSLGRMFGFVGALRSIWKLLRAIVYHTRPAGQAHHTGQMLNLELKMNMVLKRSEAMFKYELSACALQASDQLDLGRHRAAVQSLRKGLRFVIELGQDDAVLSTLLDPRIRQRVRKLLRSALAPAPLGAGGAGAAPRHRLEPLEAEGDYETLVAEMVRLLEQLASDGAAASSCPSAWRSVPCPPPNDDSGEARACRAQPSHPSVGGSSAGAAAASRATLRRRRASSGTQGAECALPGRPPPPAAEDKDAPSPSSAGRRGSADRRGGVQPSAPGQLRAAALPPAPGRDPPEAAGGPAVPWGARPRRKTEAHECFRDCTEEGEPEPRSQEEAEAEPGALLDEEEEEVDLPGFFIWPGSGGVFADLIEKQCCCHVNR